MSEDRIEIRDLFLRGIVGINDWERDTKQDIIINITLSADLRAVGASDRIEDSVNYRAITKQVIAHVESAQPYTVEALATDIARICLSNSGVAKARVRVEKPGALRFSRSVGVEIERRPEDFA